MRDSLVPTRDMMAKIKDGPQLPTRLMLELKLDLACHVCVPTTETLSERVSRAKRYFVAAIPKGMREALFPANLFSHWSLVIGL